jgi:hypothetical protein
LKRGDREEKTPDREVISIGENNLQLGLAFNMMSVFFEKKDVKIPEYQEKTFNFKAYGTLQSENKVVLLGEKTIDLSIYINRIKHSLQLYLSDGHLSRNTLFLTLSILEP